MFSSFPKLLDRAFIIGFQLPVLIFLSSITYLVSPSDFKRFVDASATDQTVGFSVLIAISWVLAVLFCIGNYWIYLLLGGYTGPFKRESWRRAAEKEFTESKRRIDSLASAVGQTERVNRDRERRQFLQIYPPPRLISPTRFGNVIESFEAYPFSVYGVDSIATWPRLQGVIPKSFMTLLNDSRSHVDFFVNCWMLAVSTAIGCGACAIYTVALFPRHEQISLPIAAAAFALALGISWLCYEAAVLVAVDWGDAVKTAFDLYLPTLANQLGYELPDSNENRKKFWNNYNRRFLYWQPIDDKVAGFEQPVQEKKRAKPSNSDAGADSGDDD